MKDNYIDELFKLIIAQTNILAEAIKEDWKIPITIAVMGSILTGTQILLQHLQYQAQKELQQNQYNLQLEQFRNKYEDTKKTAYINIFKDIYLNPEPSKINKEKLLELISIIEALGTDQSIISIINEK